MTVRLSKAIPVTDRGGPYVYETSRLPHFLDNRLTYGSKVVGLTRLQAAQRGSLGFDSRRYQIF
jgi:hypothetical protein